MFLFVKLAFLAIVLLQHFVFAIGNFSTGGGNSTTSREDELLVRFGVTTRSPIIPPPSNYRYICQEDKEEIELSRKSLGIRCRCPMIYAPVCGSDNITYHNRCFMHCRAKHATDLYHRYRLTLKKFGEC